MTTGTVELLQLNRDSLIQLVMRQFTRIESLERENRQLNIRHRASLKELARVTQGEIAFYYDDERSQIRSGGNVGAAHCCSNCEEEIARGDLVHYVNEGLLQHVTC